MLKFKEVIEGVNIVENRNYKSGFELFVGKPVGHAIKTISVTRNNPTTLVAGQTGSGKSNMILSIVAGMFDTKESYVMVDYYSPKGSDELFAGELSKAGVAINSHIGVDTCVSGLLELESTVKYRIDKIAEAGYSSIDEYNSYESLALCDSLVIIDEFTCLLEGGHSKGIDEVITKLLKVAASVGIYILLATQDVQNVPKGILGNCSNIVCLRVNERTSDILLGSDIATTCDWRDRHAFVKSPGYWSAVLEYEVPYIDSNEFKEICISHADFEV